MQEKNIDLIQAHAGKRTPIDAGRRRKIRKEAEKKLAYPNDAAGRGAAVREHVLLRHSVGTTLGYAVFGVDVHVVVD